MSEIPGRSMVVRAVDYVAVRGVFRSSGRQLLGILVALFIVFPFLDAASWGDTVFNWCFSAVLLSALLAVGGGRRTVLVIGLLLLAPTLALRWLPREVLLLSDSSLSLASHGVFVGFVCVQLLRYVLRTPKVDAEVLAASVSIYLLLGWLWTFLFRLCALIQPHSISVASPDGPSLYNMFYFSFSTLTTLGYGDILPVSRQARMLAILETTCGVLYLTVLVARLVSLYRGAGMADNPSSPHPSRPAD